MNERLGRGRVGVWACAVIVTTALTLSVSARLSVCLAGWLSLRTRFPVNCIHDMSQEISTPSMPRPFELWV